MRVPGEKAACLLALAALAGCASLPEAQPIGQTPWALRSHVQPQGGGKDIQSPGWFHQILPGKKPVRYRYERHEGRDAIAAVADAAASLVRHRLRVPPGQLGMLQFSWRVPELIAEADLSRPELADSPVRIVLAFDGDRSRLSGRDALLSELMRSVTGEELPYATLMYVWSSHKPPGSVVVHPRTPRIRSVVLESGRGQLNRWRDHERDIRADFRRVFGEEPGALVGIAVMTDSDNTRSKARAWYGPLRLLPIPDPAP